MKNLINAILTSLLILTTLFSYAQESETVTLVCSKDLHGATDVFLDLNGEVTTEFWDKDYIRVVIQIKSNGVSREVVKHLMTIKRFNVSGMRINENTFELSMPNIDLPAFINGQELQEDLSFQLFLPHYTLVMMQSELLAKNTAITTDK
jgi:hypothetical protein